MILVWLLTAILQSTGDDTAIHLWHWFGDNPLLTILLLIFFA